jgi:hypothetical protein
MMLNRTEFFLASCLCIGVFIACVPILPLFLALVCSLLSAFISRNESNLVFFRRIRFRGCGFDRQAPVDPSSFLSRMKIARVCLVIVSLFLLLLYVFPLVLLLSPRFAKPLTRVEVTKCNETSSGLRINDAYLLKSEKVTCDNIRGNNVYHCSMFATTEEQLSIVEIDPCHINLGTGLNIFVLGSNSLLVLLTLLVNAMNVVSIARI